MIYNPGLSVRALDGSPSNHVHPCHSPSTSFYTLSTHQAEQGHYNPAQSDILSKSVSRDQNTARRYKSFRTIYKGGRPAGQSLRVSTCRDTCTRVHGLFWAAHRPAKKKDGTHGGDSVLQLPNHQPNSTKLGILHGILPSPLRNHPYSP